MPSSNRDTRSWTHGFLRHATGISSIITPEILTGTSTKWDSARCFVSTSKGLSEHHLLARIVLAIQMHVARGRL